MKNIRFYNDGIKVENKRIILRLDLNVPVKNGFINDTTRIDLCLPFIKNLTDKKAKLIIISHLGRPKNEHDKSLSLRPIYEYLKKISDEALYAYNVYQIEGEGRNLFSNIEGDENTIMGLPVKKIKEYISTL